MDAAAQQQAETDALNQTQKTVADLEKELKSVDGGLNANPTTEGDVAPEAQGGGLAAVKAACDAAIARRLTDLAAVKPQVDTATHVSPANRASLGSQIDAATTGLGQLQATIDADVTLPKLRADCKLIVTSFRVYLLAIPKAHLVVGADRVQTASESLTRLSVLLEGRIKAAQAKGKNITAAQGYVNDIPVKAQGALDAAKGVPGTVVTLEAVGYPANRSMLAAARESVSTARGALTGALSAAKQAIDQLKGLG